MNKLGVFEIRENTSGLDVEEQEQEQAFRLSFKWKSKNYYHDSLYYQCYSFSSCYPYIASTVALGHKLHLMALVAGHGRYHVVIDFQVMVIPSQNRRAAKCETRERVSTRGDHVERVIAKSGRSK